MKKLIKIFIKLLFVLLVINTIRLQWRNSILESRWQNRQEDFLTIATQKNTIIKLQGELESLKFKLSNSDDSCIYKNVIENIFTKKGIYIPVDKTVKFYTKPDCKRKSVWSKKKKNFVSPIWIEYESDDNDDNTVVYLYWSTEGPVYATDNSVKFYKLD